MPDTFDQQTQLATPYAAALFALARSAGKLDEVRQELEDLVELRSANELVAAFLDSAALDDEKRAAGLEKALRGRISDDLLNTLLVMNRRGRCGLLPALLRVYTLRQEQHAGQVEVTVSSAVELSRSQRAEVEKSIAAVSGKKPICEYAVAPQLLGGLIVQIGDLRYDNSVRRQLDTARRRLADRGELGLEVGVKE